MLINNIHTTIGNSMETINFNCQLDLTISKAANFSYKLYYVQNDNDNTLWNNCDGHSILYSIELDILSFSIKITSK